MTTVIDGTQTTMEFSNNLAILGFGQAETVTMGALSELLPHEGPYDVNMAQIVDLAQKAHDQSDGAFCWALTRNEFRALAKRPADALPIRAADRLQLAILACEADKFMPPGQKSVKDTALEIIHAESAQLTTHQLQKLMAELPPDQYPDTAATLRNLFNDRALQAQAACLLQAADERGALNGPASHEAVTSLEESHRRVAIDKETGSSTLKCSATCPVLGTLCAGGLVQWRDVAEASCKQLT